MIWIGQGNEDVILRSKDAIWELEDVDGVHDVGVAIIQSAP